MSKFSNPAELAKQNADAYVRAMLDVLAGRDFVQVLSDQRAALESRTRDLSPEQVSRPEREGKWSIVQVLQHLADSELVFGYRLRMIIAHDEPPIHGFDQDRWAKHLGYSDSRLEETMDMFRALRAANLRIIRSLTPEQLQRGGSHDERGRETVYRLMELTAAHDLIHQRQIDRIRETLKVMSDE